MINHNTIGSRSEARPGFSALHQRLYLLFGHARPDALPGAAGARTAEEDFGEIKIMKSQNPLIDEPTDGAAEAANTETQADCARSDTRAPNGRNAKSLKFVKKRTCMACALTHM